MRRFSVVSQFLPVHDFRKPWWGVAYVPCMTNLQALYVWVIRWHVTGMLSLAQHWQGRQALSNHVCAQSVISMWHVVCLQHLARACSTSVYLSIAWSRCHNAYRDLWIMTTDSGSYFDQIMMIMWSTDIPATIKKEMHYMKTQSSIYFTKIIVWV